MEEIPVPKIDVLRERAKLTQRALSDIVGVTENTIQNWESGRAGLKQIEMVIKFCKALKCNPEDLIEFIPAPKREPIPEREPGSTLAELRRLLNTDKQSQASAGYKLEIPVPRIDVLRERAELTQRALSDIVGVTENTIQNWERGRAGLEQIERVIKFCKALKCNPEDLIEPIPVPEGEQKSGATLAKLRRQLKTDKQSQITNTEAST